MEQDRKPEIKPDESFDGKTKKFFNNWDNSIATIALSLTTISSALANNPPNGSQISPDFFKGATLLFGALTVFEGGRHIINYLRMKKSEKRDIPTTKNTDEGKK